MANGWSIRGAGDVLQVAKWSLLYDSFSIVLVNLPLLLTVLVIGKQLQKKSFARLLALLFTSIHTLAIFLNTADIFYFRFHLQRADADLLYVIRNPFANGTIAVLLLIIAAIVFCTVTGIFIYRNLLRIFGSTAPVNRYYFTNSLLILCCILFFMDGSKKIIPTYPLTELQPAQLPLAQNSFHSFIYSLYRRNEVMIPDKKYMPLQQQQTLFGIYKKNNTAAAAPKNIVLFIMESVPLDYFDSSSPYKVAMPFLDSLINKSTFYSNAFSYSYSSNKGITAMLAGVPTMTDIPLYHSNFISIPHTAVGNELAKKNYRSAFFIGDNYDDFGFAKCCKWLGIQQYYCMQDIPGYQQMEKHSMGLHDEYVLRFMQQQLKQIKEPFFAIQYNISTHYPHNIPQTFIDRYPGKNSNAPMKTMQYYNDCLQVFFENAKTAPWYNNSIFIFCADHWAQPHYTKSRIDEVESFRIPIFIYDPSDEKKETVSTIASQMDLLNTILHYSGHTDSIISYGKSLKDSMPAAQRTIFTKTNTAIYQALNNEYVLGFDALQGKPVYCYAYKKDRGRTINLLKQPGFNRADTLILEMKAYLQTASGHYRNREY
jgi:phosphoglycerol transferase MdoB-like AlkP superfamily enzyme